MADWPKWTVTEVRDVDLSRPCLTKDCPAIFVVKLQRVTDEEIVAVERTPTPDENGWLGGYCPDHVDLS